MFDNEQDEDAGYVMKHNTGKKFDKKTQVYLEKIKHWQYTDEYDDTLEYDDKNRRHKDHNIRHKYKKVTLKLDEDEVTGHDDEIEDINPTYTGRGKEFSNIPDEGSHRGGKRGGFRGRGRKGRGAKGAYEKYQNKRKNNREYDRKQR